MINISRNILRSTSASWKASQQLHYLTKPFLFSSPPSSFSSFSHSPALFNHPHVQPAYSISTAPTTTTQDSNLINIYFGSTTGTAQGFAEYLAMQTSSAPELQHFSPNVNVIDLAQLQSIEQWKRDFAPQQAINVFVVACYGSGEPTDNAKAFYYSLMSQDPKSPSSESSWNHMRFAVFGLGNSKNFKNNYNIVGLNIDQKFNQIGAIRVFDLGLGDDGDDVESDFDSWSNSFIKSLPATLVLPQKKQATQSIASKNVAGFRWHNCSHINQNLDHLNIPPLPIKFTAEDNLDYSVEGTSERVPYLSKLVRKENLINDRSQARSMDRCYHIAFSIPPHLEYAPGDHIGIYPQNIPHEVDAFLNTFFNDKLNRDNNWPISPYDRIHIEYEKYGKHFISSIHELITKILDFSRPTSILLKKWALWIDEVDPQEAYRLGDLASTENFKADVISNGLTTVDILATFPNLVKYARSDVDHFLEFLYMFQTMSPRLYSIASSQGVYRDQAHAVIRLHAWAAPKNANRTHFGLCSSYIDHIPINSDVPIYVRSSEFHLPKDRTTPIVMIAAGTGVAPFISFIQERRLAMERGETLSPALLFIGARSRSHFFFYDLIEKAKEDGVLTEVFVAYSYDLHIDWWYQTSGRKQFVHQHFAENIDLVTEIGLNPDNLASFYVCGGSKGFGEGIREVVGTLLCNCDIYDAQTPQEALKCLADDHLYFEDLA